MSDEGHEERRQTDRALLDAINGLSDRVLSTERGLNRQLEQLRQKQEKQFAIVLTLQDRFERVDLVWQTAKAVGARLAKFTAWGCGVVLALGALFVAAVAAGIIHIR